MQPLTKSGSPTFTLPPPGWQVSAERLGLGAREGAGPGEGLPLFDYVDASELARTAGALVALLQDLEVCMCVCVRACVHACVRVCVCGV